jgi:nitrogen regulatory protein PII-like uncharacterized protein
MRYYFNQGSVAISKDFDSVKVNEDLDKFKNDVEGGVLTTSFDGRVVCKADVSKIYYNFDFATFSKSILSEITKYFTPEKYALKIASGVQEIRLVGDELYIDNQKYKKMISIVNSTDKSKALSMNIGLVKVDDKNRVQSYTILTSFSNKHYKSTLPEKIKSFSDNLINFNIDINFHIKTIEDLKNKEVSIVSFVKSILYKEDGKVIKTVELKLRALGYKLYREYGFKKNYSELSNLTDAKVNSITDFEINSKTVYDAYLELFKDSDTSIIARESRRIIDALENC